MKTFKEFMLEGIETVEAKVVVEVEGDKAEYEAFFKKTLKKYGVEEPDELEGGEKKKFFDEIDAGWKGDKEED